ncbi:hypothetical protein [Vibrio tubiashii]|uniref:hypothetical protein n=1 Tax=Vibrio tubiashii TaxID=29498 RepID=UPI00349EAF69
MIKLANFDRDKRELIIQASSKNSGGYNLTRLLVARQQCDGVINVVIIGNGATKVHSTIAKEIEVLNKFTSSDYSKEFNFSLRT